MNKQKILNELKQSFMLKKLRAEEKCNELISSLRENEDFNEIYTDYTKKQIELLKTNIKEEETSLRKDIEELQKKIELYLQQNGLNPSNLTPQYDCPLCRDTGIVGGKYCSCLSKELNNKISQMNSSQFSFKSFSDCDLTIMSETDIKIMEKLKEWCDKYPHISKLNINLIGNAGSGKTFLLECLANEMLNKNLTVIFKTAFNLNEICRQYHIGKSDALNDIIYADILIIDDLGTEPILKNVTKEYLYNIINQRQVNKKPTIISTNLSLNDILDRYDERIFSRLGNKMLSINCVLTSKDKRLN